MSDLVVGVLFDPRLDPGSELERLVGPCARYLPIMVHLDSQRPWLDLLTNVGYAMADAREGFLRSTWEAAPRHRSIVGCHRAAAHGS